MTEDFISFIRWFFSTSWDFFEGVTVPGLTITFADYVIGFAVVGVLLRLLTFLFGVFNSDGRADSPKNVRISRVRSRDER